MAGVTCPHCGWLDGEHDSDCNRGSFACTERPHATAVTDVPPKPRYSLEIRISESKRLLPTMHSGQYHIMLNQIAIMKALIRLGAQ